MRSAKSRARGQRAAPSALRVSVAPAEIVSPSPTGMISVHDDGLVDTTTSVPVTPPIVTGESTPPGTCDVTSMTSDEKSPTPQPVYW